MGFQHENLLQFYFCAKLSHFNFWTAKNGKKYDKIWVMLYRHSYIIFIQKCERFTQHWSQIEEKQCMSGLLYISRWIKTKISGQNIAKIGLNFRDFTSSI